MDELTQDEHWVLGALCDNPGVDDPDLLAVLGRQGMANVQQMTAGRIASTLADLRKKGLVE